MNDLTLMKRLTDIRDDLIEDAYLPSAVPLPSPRPRALHMALLGKIAVAAAACVVTVGVIVGIGAPMFKNWIIPALSGTDTETAEATETEAEDTTATEKIEFSVVVRPETAKPGDTVEIEVVTENHDLEWDPIFSLYLTYGTIPVSRDVFSYEAQLQKAPFTFTFAVPENAPIGQYDLSLVSAGTDQAVCFEKALTVEASDKAASNPYVWFTSKTDTVSPLLWNYAWREVSVFDDPDQYECWGYVYADGRGYLDSSLARPEELPTVVWSEDMIVYHEGEVMKDPELSVYNADGDQLGRVKQSELLSELKSGIYYLGLFDSYYGTDHTDEVMQLAREIDAAWSDIETAMQDLVREEFEKDPNVFKDRYYCEHMLRVIIP